MSSESLRSELRGYKPVLNDLPLDDLTAFKIGEPIILSAYAADAQLFAPKMFRSLEEFGLVDAVFIVLEQDARRMDVLELHFTHRPGTRWEDSVAGLGSALARIYRLRRTGTVAGALATNLSGWSGPRPKSRHTLSPDNPDRLTPAEQRVAELVARGLSPKVIASSLDLAVATVRTHLRRIYEKTDTYGYNALALKLMQAEAAIHVERAAELRETG
ncbi:hypothetical protein HKCCE3408_00920 [Rhodobacterales bacterium HKCCE3408]|nr:hypothetical protein [Rhodobacterales bacterium HKCCE3408]